MKQELQNIGEGDEQSMALRTQLALNVYVDFQRELEGMADNTASFSANRGKRSWPRKSCSKPRFPTPKSCSFSATTNCTAIWKAAWRSWNRIVALHVKAAAPGTEKSFGFERTATDLAETKNQLAAFEEDARQEIREARRIELDRELGSLKRQAEILAEQIAGFQKRSRRSRTRRNRSAALPSPQK